MKSGVWVVFVGLIFLFSCKENIMDSELSGNVSLINQAAGITNVGAEHNLGLDYLTFDSTYSFIDTLESRRLYDSSFSILLRINSQYDSSAIRAFGYQFADLIAGQNMDTVLKDYFNGILPTLIPKFSLVELTMINEARNYLYNYNFSGMSNTQIYDHVISKADSLLADFSAIDWDTVSSASYMKGEAIGGFLAVMKSSAEYWKTQAPVNDPQPLLVIQADAAGYLGAWGGAVFMEIWDTGRIDIKNSNHRIGVGTLGAITASGGRAYSKYGGWIRKTFGL